MPFNWMPAMILPNGRLKLPPAVPTSSYSVLTKYAYSQITIVATTAEVRLLFEETLIARHPRDWERE
ncbi:Mu transposase domain-containing protein [Gimesia sp.]|uniref:Mu transposase domain-containing protein n=1 Tax=Gimesia sp. TaxID=2024833 RepID=UPI003A8E96C8